MPPMHEAKKIAIQNGELYYFTGEPCGNGHIAKKYTKCNTCIECRRMHTRNNADKYKPRVRKWWLNKTYKITEELYNELFVKQNGICAICNKEESTKARAGGIKPLAVDHCHKTNKIRGLLCHTCNVGIGHLKHDSELLKKAAVYCE